ncbi:MAG: hypothetical protein P8J37_23200 [Fuerstiella sp.]|nr:hypothetical protein [Fuerstiella sp.]
MLFEKQRCLKENTEGNRIKTDYIVMNADLVRQGTTTVSLLNTCQW